MYMQMNVFLMMLQKIVSHILCKSTPTRGQAFIPELCGHPAVPLQTQHCSSALLPASQSIACCWGSSSRFSSLWIVSLCSWKKGRRNPAFATGMISVHLKLAAVHMWPN